MNDGKLVCADVVRRLYVRFSLVQIPNLNQSHTAHQPGFSVCGVQACRLCKNSCSHRILLLFEQDKSKRVIKTTVCGIGGARLLKFLYRLIVPLKSKQLQAKRKVRIEVCWHYSNRFLERGYAVITFVLCQ